MAGNNPYAAPKANLATPDSGEIDTTSPFSPKGRFARSTYLAYSFGTMFVMWLLIVAVAGTGFARTDASDMGTGTTVITVVAYLAIIVVSTIFGIRRLHDLSWSGWWMVAMYVPIVNIVLAVPVLFFRGTAGPNQYGPPRPPRTLHLVLAWLLGFIPVAGILAAIAIPAYVDYTKRAKANALPQPPAIEQPQDARP